MLLFIELRVLPQLLCELASLSPKLVDRSCELPTYDTGALRHLLSQLEHVSQLTVQVKIMLFMVIERLRNRDAKAVYSRYREKGRMMPDGLKYLGSWTETNFDRCFQLMESKDQSLFQKWIAHWKDLVEFEIVPVVTGAEAEETT